jgi:hypothetical protein
VENGYLMRAQFLFDLVPSDQKPGDPSFAVIVIFDPRYRQPLLVVANVVFPPTEANAAAASTPLSTEETVVCRLAGATVVEQEAAVSHPVVWRRHWEPSAVRGASGQGCYRPYKDRWPVEQLPQAGKQMLGAGRQFVSGEESRQRLPELALFAGAVLIYEAVNQQAIATGFWDRRPQGTIGRLQRALARTHFSDWVPLRGEIRKKGSPTAHLPKGVLGHRRQKRDEIPTQPSLRCLACFLYRKLADHEKPDIILSDDPAEDTDAALHALVEHTDPPEIFQQGGALVRFHDLEDPDEGGATIRPVVHHCLKQRPALLRRGLQETKDGGEKPVSPRVM